MKKIVYEKDYIIKTISNYSTQKETALALNISVDTLRKILREYNISFSSYAIKRKKSRVKIRPDIDKEWLILNWVNSSKSMKQLAKENNISESILDNRRAKFKLKKRYKYKFNSKKLFNTSDTHVYYLAGLIATYGYLPKNCDALELSLTGLSEKHLLQDIRNYFESDTEINLYRNSYRLRIAGSGIKDFFYRYFKIPSVNKTKNIETPHIIEEDKAKAYIRGCLDGDGYISKKHYCFTLCTESEEFISGLKSIIKYFTNIDVSYYFEQRKDKKYPCISCNGDKAKKILDWVYSLENCFKLERKYDNYLKVKDIV